MDGLLLGLCFIAVFGVGFYFGKTHKPKSE
jgi:hypothetical protein